VSLAGSCTGYGFFGACFSACRFLSHAKNVMVLELSVVPTISRSAI